jgi:hypothetical protein
MDLFVLTLAYRFVAVTLMLGQVNSFCTKLELPLDHAVTEADVRNGSHVGPANAGNFTGSILIDQYYFGFGRGHLANFGKRGVTPNSDSDVKRRNIELSKLSSLIDTNGAYQMATNWLAKSGVDVPLLEAKYRLNIIQWRYYPDGQPSQGLQATTRKAVMLPVYEVQWRGSLVRGNRKRPERPVVSMTISGVTKELLEYHLLDDSLMPGPAIQINEPEKLLAIQDAEFQKYDALQRSNLITQFSGPSPTIPGASSSPNKSGR